MLQYSQKGKKRSNNAEKKIKKGGRPSPPREERRKKGKRRIPSVPKRKSLKRRPACFVGRGKRKEKQSHRSWKRKRGGAAFIAPFWEVAKVVSWERGRGGGNCVFVLQRKKRKERDINM